VKFEIDDNQIKGISPTLLCELSSLVIKESDQIGQTSCLNSFNKYVRKFSTYLLTWNAIIYRKLLTFLSLLYVRISFT